MYSKYISYGSEIRIDFHPETAEKEEEEGEEVKVTYWYNHEFVSCLIQMTFRAMLSAIMLGTMLATLESTMGGGGNKEIKFGQNCDLTNLFDWPLKI